VHRAAVLVAIAAFAAGCGGSSATTTTGEPEIALLTDVRVAADSVEFEFRGDPQEVLARYVGRDKLLECGSGAAVPLKGDAFMLVNIRPARTADIEGEQVVPTYTGPKRIAGPGPVLEVVKVCDFESDVGWAIGLEHRIDRDVSTDDGTVRVTFR
jgi:hypothetical protein